MFKKFSNYISEMKSFRDETQGTSSQQYPEFEEELKEMVTKTVNNTGGNINDFINSFNRQPDDYPIEGLINDSDIYDFYLKWRIEIDSILLNTDYFNEKPSDNNIYGLYEFTIGGTKRAVIEIVKNL
jgi:hypothetical protein